MADFEKAFKKTLKFEGGYANDLDDNGGKTMYGITEAVARLRGYKGTMRDLPLELAKKIYKSDYWDVNKLDKLPQILAENIFDCGVNCGVKTAAKMLQKVLSVVVDSIIGTKTIEAANKTDEKLLVLSYLDERVNYYHQICKNNPSQNKFLKGWLNRVKKLKNEVS